MAMGAELLAISDPNAAHPTSNLADAAKAAGCPAHVQTPTQTDAPAKELRIRLDRDLCQGHAVCVGEAPDVFAISPNDGKVMLKMARPSAEYHEQVRAAERHCPTRTIRIEE